MSTAHRYLPSYTVDDYQLWEGDWELWDGIAVAMSPAPFGRHQAVAVRISSILLNSIESNGCDATVMGEMDWIVNGNTVVCPDVMVVCGGFPEKHVESPPALIVEIISASSIVRDTIYKRDLFEQEGVPNYLVVDLPKESAWIHRNSKQWEKELMEQTCVMQICDDCEIELNMAKVFEATRPR